MKVEVRNGNIERALSIFKRKCNEIILEVKEREAYEKPTTARRRAIAAARIRESKRQDAQTARRS